jgi:NAD-dependent dihydropyrimidine dehydrogenase PreA subunit
MEVAMVQLSDHPTVRRVRAAAAKDAAAPAQPLDAEWLRTLCLEAGADDVGFVALEHPDLAAHKADILALFPAAKALISIVCRMNRENIRTPMRSIANLEFHHTTNEVNDVARRIVRSLDGAGVRAINGGAAGFPMEADRWESGRLWLISHKPIAVAAGLGQMGIHRNVIHPRFGSFVLLGTVIVAAEIATYAKPLDFNPCLECKLCVAACPTGAVSPDGHFNFAACYTHNYREFMGGFGDWVETVASSDSAHDYRQKVSGAETVSMWQSLSFGANYKAAYCLSVCPAGEDVIGPYLADRKQFMEETLKPLREKAETVYVARGTDAEDFVPRSLPHKRVKIVRAGLPRQTSIPGFLRALPLVFQRGRSKGLAATYHFTFTGSEPAKATVVIGDRTLKVASGHAGEPDLRVIADSDTWLRFLRKEASLPWALLRRRIRLKGSPRLLLAFGRCFPS